MVRGKLPPYLHYIWNYFENAWKTLKKDAFYALLPNTIQLCSAIMYITRKSEMRSANSEKTIHKRHLTIFSGSEMKPGRSSPSTQNWLWIPAELFLALLSKLHRSPPAFVFLYKGALVGGYCHWVRGGWSRGALGLARGGASCSSSRCFWCFCLGSLAVKHGQGKVFKVQGRPLFPLENI